MHTHQAQKKSKKASYCYKKNAKKCIFYVIYGKGLTLGFKKKHRKIVSNILNRSPEIFDTNRRVSAEIAILAYFFS